MLFQDIIHQLLVIHQLNPCYFQKINFFVCGRFRQNFDTIWWNSVKLDNIKDCIV